MVLFARGVLVACILVAYRRVGATAREKQPGGCGMGVTRLPAQLAITGREIVKVVPSSLVLSTVRFPPKACT